MKTECTNHSQARRPQFTAGLALFAFMLALNAEGQTTPPPAATDENVVRLDRFEVTGSYIPVAGTVTAIPVTTINAANIEAAAVNTSVLEVLRKTTPQFMGNQNLGNSNANISSGFTGGGSQLAFRNTQTLVLINGRRSAYAPVLSSGGFQFVDVNLIPISAIEKIEILQDGASAIYGTDAVAGVVNIILKSDYTGAEAGFRYGWSDNDGNYAERRGWFVTGAGNDRTNITVTGEWTRTDPLFQYERPFSREAFGTVTFGGVVESDATFDYFVLNPSLNAPPMNTDLSAAQLIAQGIYVPVDPNNLAAGRGTERQYAFNLSRYSTLQLGNERRSASLNFDHRFNDAIDIFGDLMYSQTKTYSQLNAQPSYAFVEADDPSNPFDEDIWAYNRFLDYPRAYFYDTTNLRAVLGAKGRISENFGWEIGALTNRIEQNYRNTGLIDTAAREAATASGTINYFAREQAPGALEASGIFGTALGQSVSELTAYDARVNGTLFQLPAGELAFAAGVEYRNERLTQTADRNSQSATFGWDSATTLDPFAADRDIEAAFAQVRVPLLGSNRGDSMLLEVEAAVRHERYSDTDDPTVPKYSLRFLPWNDEFALRATYSESFAAPTLFDLFGPGGIGFTPSLNLTRFGGGASITGQANARSGSNPNLRPATSENYTVGFVWSPKRVRGLSASVDWFSVEQEGLISTIGTATILQDVELLGPASPYAQYVRFGPTGDTSQFSAGAPVTAPGQVGNTPRNQTYVTNTLVNIAGQRLAGLDMKAAYSWNHEEWGRFDAHLAGIWWSHYKATTLPGTAEFDTVGQATPFNGTIPEWQTYLSVAWERGPLGGTLGWTHIPSVRDAAAFDPTDPAADEYVEAYNSVDLSASYTFGSERRWTEGLAVRLGVNNVFNEMPPMAAGTFTDANADTATYNPIGRFYFVEARYRF